MIRFGLLGCGDVTTRLFIPGIRESKRAVIRAIAGRDILKAHGYAIRLDAAAEISYESLLKRDDVDAVYIGLPISMHHEWAIKALQAGKHVYCEKTLAPSLRETLEIKHVAQVTGRRLMEGLMYRFHPLLERVKSHIKSAGGRQFTGRFLIPGSSGGRDDLYELGCYPISAAREVFCAEPIAVSATLDSTLIEFGHGLALCEFGYYSQYRCEYTADDIHVDRAFSTPADMLPKIRFRDGSEEIVRAANHFTLAVDAFCEAIETNGSYGLIEGDILPQARTLEAVRISLREKRRVLWGSL